MRAIASLALKPDWKTAMADLNEAVRLSPSDAFARGSRGVASLAQGDVARAQADLDEAIRLDPRNPAYVIDRAAAWRHRREYDKAIADCDAALRLDPRSITALVLAPRSIRSGRNSTARLRTTTR